jgi:VanZ family protein
MSKLKYYLPSFSWLLIITLLSLMSTKNLTKFTVDIVSFDKLAHIFIYAVLSFFIAWGIKKSLMHKNLSLKILALIFLSTSTYGILMEIAQMSLSTGRHFEYYDIIANIIGSFIGLLFYLRKKR